MTDTALGLETLNGLMEHEPTWWPDVLARVAEGKGYWEIARERMVKPALFRGWIGGDPAREAAYQKALEYRKEYRQELAAANVSEIAQVVHQDSSVSVGDTLKAAGMVLDKGGEGKGGGGVTVIVQRRGTEPPPALTVSDGGRTLTAEI